MRIAITGVAGFVGRHLATRALADGHDVVGFSRRPWTGPPYVPLDDRAFLVLPGLPAAQCFDRVDVLVHLAAATQSADPDESDAVNRLGSERLFAAAREHGVGRLVFVSSQSAHDGSTSPYARSKLAVERHLEGATDAVVVRPGLVYGDSDEGLMGRVTRAASKLRVVPVVGGADARVQTIHVDALCRAILRLCEADDPPPVVELADPTVRRLDAVLRDETARRFGARPAVVPVPVPLARGALRGARRLGITLPVTEDSVDGIRTFRPMDTRGDLAAVGLTDVHESAPLTPRAVGTDEPRRVLLVGAGRVGMIHAPTAMHHQRMVLCGVVDRHKPALDRLTALLGAVPGFTDLDEALVAVAPDAAIVATPPSSHLPVTRRLLAAGVDVLIEKPITATPGERAELLADVVAHPERYLAAGYLSGIIPHVAAVAAGLRDGRYGIPRSFHAFAFVTRIEGKEGRQELWEFDPATSGGGALINLGVHMLGMIDLLVGPMELERARLSFARERAVEDGAALELRAAGIPGTFVTGWHVAAYDMPLYCLRVETDRGMLVLTSSCSAFFGRDGEIEITHQIDVDPVFDLAPMDAGGAFWTEQDLLARRIAGPNSLELAARVESLIEDAYATAERADPATVTTPTRTDELRIGGERDVVLDVRDALGASVHGDGAVMFDSALAARDGFADDAIVSVPDATSHFRTFTNQGPGALVRTLGVTNLGAAATGIRLGRAAAAHTRSWEALLLLLRAELRRLDRDTRACVVVDAYFVDLATATAAVDPLRAALDAIRRRCRHARVGLEANAAVRLAPWLPQLASHLDVVVALGSTRPESLAPVIDLLPDSVELVVKTGVVPGEVAALAWEEPERWTRGEHRLVVPWNGAPRLRDLDERRLLEASAGAGATPR